MKDFDKDKYIQQAEDMEPEEIKNEYLKLIAEYDSICVMYNELHEACRKLQSEIMEEQAKNAKYIMMIDNAIMMLGGK